MAVFGVLNEFYSNFLFKQQGDTASQLAEKPSSNVYNNNDVDELHRSSKFQPSKLRPIC